MAVNLFTFDVGGRQVLDMDFSCLGHVIYLDTLHWI